MKKNILLILVLLCCFCPELIYAKTTYTPGNLSSLNITERVTSTCYYYPADSKSDLLLAEFGVYHTSGAANGNPLNYSRGVKLKSDKNNFFFNLYKNTLGNYSDAEEPLAPTEGECEDIFFYAKDYTISWVVARLDNYDEIVKFCKSYPDAVRYCNYENDGDIANCQYKIYDCSVISSQEGAFYIPIDANDPDIYAVDEVGCPKILKLPITFIKKVVFNTLEIFVPIILIVMASVDLVKYLLNPDDKKGQPLNKVKNRIILAVAFFFITSVVSLVLNRVAKTTPATNTSSWKNCWNNIK